MKTVAFLLLSCAGLLWAQNPQPDPKPDAVKRLASVTWDLDTHKLVWVVQRGTVVNGEFVASSTERYEVSPDEAIMASKDEKRGLGEEDAGSVTDLVNLLSLYCAQSTDWWEQGSPDKETAVPKSDSKGAEPTTPATRQKDRAPRLPGTLVAANAGPGK
jgi:hypothetical protein